MKLEEFQERFANMSDDELIASFNREVGNSGWTSSRATHLHALREELKKRYDTTEIIQNGGMSLKRKVRLVGNKIEVIEE